jgi:UDP-GlcNAc:undecaprenyl-phosphate GlcNAc-1-phosphate transferase
MALPMGIFGLPVTVCWIVGIVNAINLIDGLDGLAGGIVFFAGVTTFVVAFLGGNVLLAVVMAVMLGGVLGFLFFNFNPARIFMGDSGSYFLGFLLGTSSISGYKASTAVALLVPVLALGVPIFDTLFTILRRFLERRPIFSPDRGHIHHRLLDMGLTQRRVVLTLYGVSVVFAMGAIALSLGRSWQAGFSIVLASVLAVGLFRSSGYFDYVVRLSRQKVRLRTSEAERLRRAVPNFLATLDHVENESGVWTAIGDLLGASGLAKAILKDTSDNVVSEWAGTTADAEATLSARYPLGQDQHSRAAVVFRWGSIEGRVDPQVDILLQLAADALAKALSRTNSEWAPQIAETTQVERRSDLVPERLSEA